MTIKGKLRILTGVSLLLGPALAMQWLQPARSDLTPVQSGVGSAENLLANYQSWADERTRSSAPQTEVVSIGWFKGLSTTHSQAHGEVKIDLKTGVIGAQVTGLEPGKYWDLWFIDNTNEPGHSIKPETGDKFLRVGSFMSDEKLARFDAQVDPDVLRKLDPDLYVVTHNGHDPNVDRVLIGSNSVFEKLYRYDQQNRVVAADGADPQKSSSDQAGWLAQFGGDANAAIGPTPNTTTSLQRLIAAGRRSFFTETFNGNGRTCGTCHRENNNFTIDAKFIATLPPNDPLFVAEFNPALKKNFEDPALMRQFGLIKENADGFDDLEHNFVMRGVPHTLALLANSLKPSNIDRTNPAVIQRTGWSGDGAPGTGTLREFLIGAIVQHYPKTLNRIENQDFRLPTEAELDAIEAFQASLGRREDLKLLGPGALKLKNASAARGQEIFNNPGTFPAPNPPVPVPPGFPRFTNNNAGAGKCLMCHFNAGAGDLAEALFLAGNTDIANAKAETNANFDTGIDDLGHPAGPNRLPPDGGFGRDPLTRDGRFIGYGSKAAGRTFNTPPLVEAADTAPFFHNNAIPTIEAAISFYATPAFANSPIGQLIGPIDMTPAQIQDVGAFLRVINALENVRSAKDLARRAAQTGDFLVARDLANLAIAETDDAIEVLGARGLNLLGVSALVAAKTTLSVASWMPINWLRNISVNGAIAKLDLARSDMAF